MTSNEEVSNKNSCPAEYLLKTVSGRWKPSIVRCAVDEPVRFSMLLRQLSGITRQSLAAALKELFTEEVLEKVVLKQKPLHIEYRLTEKGKLLADVLLQLERISG